MAAPLATLQPGRGYLISQSWSQTPRSLSVFELAWWEDWLPGAPHCSRGLGSSFPGSSQAHVSPFPVCSWIWLKHSWVPEEWKWSRWKPSLSMESTLGCLYWVGQKVCSGFSIRMNILANPIDIFPNSRRKSSFRICDVVEEIQDWYSRDLAVPLLSQPQAPLTIKWTKIPHSAKKTVCYA